MTSDHSRLSAKGEVSWILKLQTGDLGCELAIELAESDWDGKDRSAVDGAVAKCFAREDCIGGRRAFLEKRSPNSKAHRAIFWWLISAASDHFPRCQPSPVRPRAALPSIMARIKLAAGMGLILIAIFRNGCANDGIRLMI
jgi:hypothetical protein